MSEKTEAKVRCATVLMDGDLRVVQFRPLSMEEYHKFPDVSYLQNLE